MVYIFVLWFVFSQRLQLSCSTRGLLRCYIQVLQSSFNRIKIWLDNLNTFSCHVACISVQWARRSRTKKERKSSTDHSPLAVLGFLVLPAQDHLCLASTCFGWVWGGRWSQEVGRPPGGPWSHFCSFLWSLLFALTRAGKNIADCVSATPSSLAAHSLSPLAPIPAMLRQAEARGRGAPYILPFPRGRLSSEASEEGKVKKRIYNPRKTLSSL